MDSVVSIRHSPPQCDPCGFSMGTVIIVFYRHRRMVVHPSAVPRACVPVEKIQIASVPRRLDQPARQAEYAGLDTVVFSPAVRL